MKKLVSYLSVTMLMSSGWVGIASAQTHMGMMMPMQPQQSHSRSWKIWNAMSAAPSRVSRNATIMDWPGNDGNFVLLRTGSNKWTCLPDSPMSPGNDPMCMDTMAMKWVDALMSHTTPQLSQPGIGYMLQGASDPSNTDPYATEPANGEDWVMSPPHVMIFPTGKLSRNIYSTDPSNGGPWIMYPGTPYQHLMIPVR